MTYFTLDFSHANRVQDFGIVMNAEGSHHLPLGLLISFLILDLGRRTQVNYYVIIETGQ